jgi:hypothetical protein
MLLEVDGLGCLMAAILSVTQTSVSELLNQTAVSDVNPAKSLSVGVEQRFLERAPLEVAHLAKGGEPTTSSRRGLSSALTVGRA